MTTTPARRQTSPVRDYRGERNDGDRGAVKGFDNPSDAEEDWAERDARAKVLGLQARYEVVAK